MKLLLTLWILVCCAAVSRAQEVAMEQVDTVAARQRILELRAIYEDAFSKAQAACYERFMVVDCQKDARRTRRAALDELRRQELVVNELERKANAAATLQRINLNTASRSKAEQVQMPQQVVQDEQVPRLGGDISGEAPQIDMTGDVSNALPNPKAVQNASHLAEQEQRYADKLKDAEKHKLEKIKSNAEKSGSTAQNLPIPKLN